MPIRDYNFQYDTEKPTGSNPGTMPASNDEYRKNKKN
jgi:hypothetical protein|tara:strand:- start:1241 stop:1351 length:111 start_codon:yes stop_codon:yes gene_type:complete